MVYDGIVLIFGTAQETGKSAMHALKRELRGKNTRSYRIPADRVWLEGSYMEKVLELSGRNEVRMVTRQEIAGGFVEALFDKLNNAPILAVAFLPETFCHLGDTKTYPHHILKFLVTEFSGIRLYEILPQEEEIVEYDVQAVLGT